MTSLGLSLALPLILGCVAGTIVYAASTGRAAALLSTPRGALIALLLVGTAMCGLGIRQVSASGRWMSPEALAGYLLGGLLLTVFVARFSGLRLPGIAGDRAAIWIVGALMALKLVVGTLSCIMRSHGR